MLHGHSTNKESLAAYVHRFKWEASRCQFNNDTTTIKIFLKGLKNAHTIAMKVYKKGPQSLTDTIKEVEKLQAAKQITSTLIPASLVNNMSSDKDKCFQCQETGHMACYCPHIKYFDCNNYGHVAMNCPDKIPPSGTQACCRNTTTSRHDRSSSRHHSHTRHSNHDYRDTGVTVAMTPAVVTPDHFIDLHIVALHPTEAQAPIATAATHHITDPNPTGISPKMTADPDHTKPANNIINQHKALLPICNQHLGKTGTEGRNRSQSMTLP